MSVILNITNRPTLIRTRGLYHCYQENKAVDFWAGNNSSEHNILL